MCVKILEIFYYKQVTIVVLLVNILYTNSKNIKENGTIYILEWTSASKEPFNYLGFGQEPFVSRNCSFQNCYMTNNHEFFDSVLDYDVLMFNAIYLHHDNTVLPNKRSEAQEYVFVGLEPAAYYGVPSIYNGYFNMTWTYKLTSDVIFPYIEVRNNHGVVIGPRKDIEWIDINDMESTDHEIIKKIKNKSIAAAWIASNCDAFSGRLNYIINLNEELAKYGHRVDIYGLCGNMECPTGSEMDKCFAKIETDYYFYLAFENSFCEDYVSEKLLHALEHYAVPIVFGGANYSRFMPDGIYLNAVNNNAEDLAKDISDIIQNPQRYFDFFKWHRYYSFHSSEQYNYHDPVCGLCALLNNKTRRNQRTVYKYMTKWWNEGRIDKKSSDVPLDMNLIIDEEKSSPNNNVFGLFSNLYNYLFEL